MCSGCVGAGRLERGVAEHARGVGFASGQVREDAHWEGFLPKRSASEPKTNSKEAKTKM